MADYKDLNVWDESILVENIYRLVSDQLRRTVVSIPSNIAEGQNRNTQKEFIRFLYIALGSVSEVETQILIAQRLNYLNYIEND